MRSDRSAAVKTDYGSEGMFANELDNLRFVGFSKDTMNDMFVRRLGVELYARSIRAM